MIVPLFAACAESDADLGPDYPGVGTTPVSDGGALAGDAAGAVGSDAGLPDASSRPAPVDASSPADGALLKDAAGGGGCVAERVMAARPIIDQCRSCHIQYALAGKTRFLLTLDPAGDEQSVRSAFRALGRDLLAMPAEEATRMHPGGKLLEQGSASYLAWDALLRALGNETTCPTN